MLAAHTLLIGRFGSASSTNHGDERWKSPPKLSFIESGKSESLRLSVEGIHRVLSFVGCFTVCLAFQFPLHGALVEERPVSLQEKEQGLLDLLQEIIFHSTRNLLPGLLYLVHSKADICPAVFTVCARNTKQPDFEQCVVYCATHLFELVNEQEISPLLEQLSMLLSPKGQAALNDALRDKSAAFTLLQDASFHLCNEEGIEQRLHMLRNTHSDDIAKALCLVDSQLLRQIKPDELLKKKWTRKDKYKVAPGLMSLIERFNVLSRWTEETVCSPSEHQDRVSALSKIIDIASKLLTFYNFNSAAALIAGCLTSQSIKDKKMWEDLPKKAKKSFKDLESVFQPLKNYAEYRLRLQTTEASAPSVPFLAGELFATHYEFSRMTPSLVVVLKDFLVVLDTIPEYLEDGRINYRRAWRLGELLQEFLKHQRTPYSFIVGHDTLNYCLNLGEHSVHPEACQEATEPRSSTQKFARSASLKSNMMVQHRQRMDSDASNLMRNHSISTIKSSVPHALANNILLRVRSPSNTTTPPMRS